MVLTSRFISCNRNQAFCDRLVQLHGAATVEVAPQPDQLFVISILSASSATPGKPAFISWVSPSSRAILSRSVHCCRQPPAARAGDLSTSPVTAATLRLSRGERLPSLARISPVSPVRGESGEQSGATFSRSAVISWWRAHPLRHYQARGRFVVAEMEIIEQGIMIRFARGRLTCGR